MSPGAAMTGSLPSRAERVAEGLQIAVIGAGAAGLTAAHLLQRRHHVTLFERERRAGGHVKTVTVPQGPDAGTPIDTGFIVFNDDNYPLFNRLLDTLEVPSRHSDMSFSYHSELSGLQYAGTGLNGLFAQRGNLVRADYWRLIAGIFRFCTVARQELDRGDLATMTLGDFLRSSGFDGMVSDDYVVPLAAAIWSASRDDIRAFPARSLLRFFDNHGLLRIRERPRWKTVLGGSRSYVEKLLAGFTGELATDHAVRGVRRVPGGVSVRRADGSSRRFDRVVLAVHADQALRLLEDPTPDERDALQVWRYNRAEAFLHTDATFMPPNRRAWASWNYRRTSSPDDLDPVVVTYHMNRLQGLSTAAHYFVSLNPGEVVDHKVLEQISYSHPCFTREAVDSQPELAGLSGKNRTYYCGSYLGYGFHEDAVRSGVTVAARFGIEL